MLHDCNTCGSPFEGRSDARCCSPRCRTQAHRQRKARPADHALGEWPYCLADKREDYWAIRDISERAASTIKAIYNHHGIHAARLAVVAAWQMYNNEDYALMGDTKNEN